MDGGNGVKTIVYNTKKDSKKEGQKNKTRKKKERESKRLKKYNSKKEEFSTLSHSTRACPRIREYPRTTSKGRDESYTPKRGKEYLCRI